MNKKTLISLGVLLVILIILFAIFKNNPSPVVAPTSDTGTTTPLDQLTQSQTDKTVVYYCDGKKSITTTYHLPDDALVDVYLNDGQVDSDGVELSLPHVISGSGARYANADESLVFWNKGNTAFLEENGTTTYVNCVTTSN